LSIASATSSAPTGTLGQVHTTRPVRPVIGGNPGRSLGDPPQEADRALNGDPIGLTTQVTGRKAPGPVDVFMYTERGIYRIATAENEARGLPLPVPARPLQPVFAAPTTVDL
jgi:hypothetical protein